MSKLLKGDEYKDCTLKNDLGESLAVHRCILASRTQRQVIRFCVSWFCVSYTVSPVLGLNLASDGMWQGFFGGHASVRRACVHTELFL
jgi:hypothetical protein